MGHIHNVYDTDNHFRVNAITRAISDVSKSKTCLIQRDHNSERFTFEIPRLVEGHDMMNCNVVQVHYLNISNSGSERTEGVYEVDDLQISPASEDMVICSWLISRNATKLVGSLKFLLRFACATGEEVDYAWHTSTYGGIKISEGIFNGEEIDEEYPDILAQWETRIASCEDICNGVVVKEDMEAVVESTLQKAKESGAFDGADGKNGKDGQDGQDGEDGFSPVVTVNGIVGGNRVSITDATGTKTFDVMDGKDGKNGTGGSGGLDSLPDNVPYTEERSSSMTFAETPEHTFSALGNTWWKVSDLVPTTEEILGGQFTTSSGGSPVTWNPTAEELLMDTEAFTGIQSAVYGMGFAICRVTGAQTVEFGGANHAVNIPATGIYFGYTAGATVPASVAISVAYTELHKLDGRLLPDGFATIVNTYIDEYIGAALKEEF